MILFLSLRRVLLVALFFILLLRVVAFCHGLLIPGPVQRLWIVGVPNICNVLLSIRIVLKIFFYLLRSCLYVVRCIVFPHLSSSPSFRLFLFALISLVLSSRTARMHLTNLRAILRTTVHHTPSCSISPDTETTWMPTGLARFVRHVISPLKYNRRFDMYHDTAVGGCMKRWCHCDRRIAS